MRLVAPTPSPSSTEEVLPLADEKVLPLADEKVLPLADEKVLPLTDGASVRVLGGAVAEVRDVEGRLLVRYENGRAEIAAPAGDLVFSAPTGRVVLQAGTDVVIDASRDLTQSAGRKSSLEAPQISAAGERILTTAKVLTQSVERLEVSATRLFEKTRETYREARGLVQTRAGRVRAVIEDAFSVTSNRTTLTSKEETSIDGKKVLLG
ncbi:MAG: DUF3540 domain-containing protein [Polyangiaceae bacterium]